MQNRINIVIETKDNSVDTMELSNFTNISKALVYEADNRELKPFLMWVERHMRYMRIPTFEDDAAENFLIKSITQN